MAWKDYHYWLRGGIIGAGLAIVLHIFNYIFQIETVFGVIVLTSPFSFWFFPFLLNLLYPNHLAPEYLQIISLWLGTLISYFIYGTIIGLIVKRNKIKREKNEFQKIPE